MKNPTRLLWAIALLAACLPAFAEEKSNVKFGKVDVADFSTPASTIVEGKDAVYLADIGKSEIVGNSKGWFTLEFRRHVRIKILNNNGFDAADFAVHLFSDNGKEEKLYSIKGITYNLENGKIVETPLKSDQVFVDRLNKKHTVKKFTLPGVKVGSIIDVEYLVASDYFSNLQAWEFQKEYPVMWSEYEVVLPEFFNYLFLNQGDGKYLVNKRGETFQTYYVTFGNETGRSETGKITSRAITHHWVMKEVAALKEEPFTSSTENYVMNVHFQLNRIQFENQPVPMYQMGSWYKLAENLNKSTYFAAGLYEKNNWLDDEVTAAIGNATDTMEMAQKIYGYIRDKYTCTSRYSIYLEDEGLKPVVKAKKGNIADLNLLLATMLQHQKIEAYPVLISTTENGFVNELYPILDRFNQTITVAVVKGKEYYLDASDPMLGFGKLNRNCYNGYGFAVAANGVPIYLLADSLKEKTATVFFATSNEQGNWEGTMESSLGYYQSLALRNSIKKDGKDSRIKSLQTSLADFQIEDVKFEHVDEMDNSITLKYVVKSKAGEDEAIRYLNPMMGKGFTENPFKSAERTYPVEMPYTQDEIYVATIDIPKGYVIDELPKSTRVKLNEDEGMFEYLINAGEEKIQMRSRVVLNKATFQPEDYETLRNFYGYVVKKHSEQIVFKKKE